MPETVAVTGASGFLGSAVCRHLRDHGYRVRALAREPGRLAADLADVEAFTCALPDAIDERAFDGPIDALVHCAFEMRFQDPARARRVNVDGSKRLFEAARRSGVGRIVFVTSTSAHPAAVSVYGRTKLAVEELLDPARDAAVRPGLLIGEGSVFWRQAGAIARLPFIPLFYGGRQPIQVLALPDACEAVRLVLARRITGSITVAHPRVLLLRELYAEVARAIDKSPVFVRFPGSLTWAALRAAEKLRIPLPLSSDNLLGLKQLKTFEVSGDLARLGLSPRSVERALSELDWSAL